MNDYDLAGRVAVVTGARRGIGKAIAMRLAREGVKVAVADLDQDDCESVVKEIERTGGEGLALKLDVTSEEEIKEAVKRTKEKFGRIDVLVNNAGIFIQQELDRMETAAIDRILSVNLRGVILCTKYVLPEMKRNNYGKIINIASIAGFIGFELSSIYCATKGALLNLTKELALELGKYRINVNCVAPGVIETAMTEDFLRDEDLKKGFLERIPYGRIGQPDDIARTVIFLASDESEYITGHTVVVDGGWLVA